MCMPKKTYKRYSDEEIIFAVNNSQSLREVMRKIGISYLSGSMHNAISLRVKKLGLSTKHFTGKGSNKGINHVGGCFKKSPEEIFIINKNGTRTKSLLLRRALLESGIFYKCFECGIDRWRGKPLVLEVEHKNGDALDNRKENVCFLCPNCHGQKPTSHRKKKPLC